LRLARSVGWPRCSSWWQGTTVRGAIASDTDGPLSVLGNVATSQGSALPPLLLSAYP